MAETNSKIKVEFEQKHLDILEGFVSRMEKAAKGKKSIRGHIFDFLFGRIMMVTVFAGYMYLQNGIPDFTTIQREVLKYDEASKILTISNRGELENYIFKNGEITKNGKVVKDSYLDQIKYAILLNLDYPVQKGFF